MRIILPIGAVAFAASIGLTAGTAFAANAVQKECSAKYQAEKSANTLNGLTYNQYYSKCAAEAKAAKEGAPAATPTATPAPAPAAPAPAPAAPAPAPTTTAKTAPAAPTTAGVVFPTAVSPTYSKESPGKARMHTCLDQYRANKTTNGNGSLKWIMKGGGYYSECNTKLKG